MTLPETTLIGLAIMIGLAVMTFWIAMIRHAWLHTTPGRERWVWLLIVVLGKFPGALGYYLLRNSYGLGAESAGDAR